MIEIILSYILWFRLISPGTRKMLPTQPFARSALESVTPMAHKGRVILKMNVHMEDGRKGTIHILPDDKPHLRAKQFTKKYNLPDDMIPVVEQYIRTNMAAMQHKSNIPQPKDQTQTQQNQAKPHAQTQNQITTPQTQPEHTTNDPPDSRITNGARRFDMFDGPSSVASTFSTPPSDNSVYRPSFESSSAILLQKSESQAPQYSDEELVNSMKRELDELHTANSRLAEVVFSMSTEEDGGASSRSALLDSLEPNYASRKADEAMSTYEGQITHLKNRFEALVRVVASFANDDGHKRDVAMVMRAEGLGDDEVEVREALEKLDEAKCSAVDSAVGHALEELRSLRDEADRERAARKASERKVAALERELELKEAELDEVTNMCIASKLDSAAVSGDILVMQHELRQRDPLYVRSH